MFGVYDRSMKVHGVWMPAEEDRTAQLNHLEDELQRLLRQHFAAYFQPQTHRSLVCEVITLKVLEVATPLETRVSHTVFVVRVEVDCAKLPANMPLCAWKNEVVLRDGASTIVIEKLVM